MDWHLLAKLFAVLCFTIVAMFVIARILAKNAIRTAIDRVKADRIFEAAKRDEDERAAKAMKALADSKVREDARIDGLNAEETEREVNK
jgi:hypothetical protein